MQDAVPGSDGLASDQAPGYGSRHGQALESGRKMKIWSDWIAAKAWRRVLFVLVCLAPLISGVASRIAKGSIWFQDFDAVACAGERLAAGLPIYEQEPTCAGMEPTGFVYLPWVARVFGAASNAIGYDGLKWSYAAVYVAAFALLGWAAFLNRKAAGSVWDRLPVLGLVTGSTIYWGNVAPILHAFVAAAALVAARHPALFALALAMAAAVKPVFLTYGIVLLVLPIPLWKRLALGAATAGLGLAPTLHFMATGGELAAQWQANLDFFVYRVQPGDGFLGWLGMLGADTGSLAAQAGWAVYAAVVTIAAVVIALRAGLTPEQRVWLGMGAGALANPRIVPLDVLMLAVLVGAVIHVARTAAISDRARKWAVGLAAGSAIVGALGNSLDAGDYAPKVFTLVITGVLVWMAVAATRRQVAAGSSVN